MAGRGQGHAVAVDRRVDATPAFGFFLHPFNLLRTYVRTYSNFQNSNHGRMSNYLVWYFLGCGIQYESTNVRAYVVRQKRSGVVQSKAKKSEARRAEKDGTVMILFLLTGFTTFRIFLILIFLKKQQPRRRRSQIAAVAALSRHQSCGRRGRRVTATAAQLRLDERCEKQKHLMAADAHRQRQS